MAKKRVDENDIGPIQLTLFGEGPLPIAEEEPAPIAILEDWRSVGSYFIATEADARGDARVLRPRINEAGEVEGTEETPPRVGELLVMGFKGPELPNVPLRHVERIRHLVEIRDAARRLLHAQRARAPKSQIADLREALNDSYDVFVARYGRLNTEALTPRGKLKRPNLAHFESDPDYPLVAALEIDVEQDILAGEDEQIEKRFEKAPIFFRDTVNVDVEPTTADTPLDALNISLDRRGRVDINYMADLLGVKPGEVVEALTGEIFLNPETNRYEVAAEYLSGPVRRKLRQAREAAERDRKWLVNVQALEAVQPDDLTPEDIIPSLGAPWIPVEDVKRFMVELLECYPEDIELFLDEHQANWTIRVQHPRARRGARAQRTWGTQRMDAIELIDCALNQRDPVVRDRIPETDPPRYRLNRNATLLAREKLGEIKEEFRRWLWADNERAVRLTRVYNDLYNDQVERHYDGSHLTLPGTDNGIELRPHQKDAVWRGIQTQNTLLAHKVGYGKAQPLDAKILTPNGWVRMGDLSIGDEIIAGDGSVTHVTGIFPQGEKKVYRVVMSDGSFTECCDDHLWLTQTYHERNMASLARSQGKEGQWASAQPKVRTLKEIRETLVGRMGVKNHSIPLVGAVDFTAREVPVEPYVMGTILGDGNTDGAGIKSSMRDPEIVAEVAAALPDGHDIHAVPSAACDYSIVGPKDMSTKARPNGVRATEIEGLKSKAKFVPDEYKFNSTDVRLAVLQGLMDTDGTVNRDGTQVSFTSVSKRLVDDVVFLVRSLGGVATYNRPRRTRYVHSGELRFGQVSHRVTISLPASINPFRLPRKADRVRPKSRYAPTRYIVDVQEVGVKPAQCISVAHESRLYVTDDLIVTHNTWEQAAIIMESRRLGHAEKPLWIVPSNMIEDIPRQFLQLYPMARLLVAGKADMTPQARDEFFARIVTSDADCVIMTHDQFAKLPISVEARRQILQDEIDALERPVIGEDRDYERARVRKARKLREKLEELNDERDAGITFEDTGIDMLVCDESHSFKAIPIMSKNRALSGAGSKRAEELIMRVRRVNNMGGKVVFATGTPIANTIMEVYGLMYYLHYDRLRELGLDHVDAWVAMFAESVTKYEMGPAGNYEAKTRFASFRNVPELRALLREFADVKMDPVEGIKVPNVVGGERRIIGVEPNEWQIRYFDGLLERIEAIRNRQVHPRDDNLLLVINDARKASLDPRLVDINAPADGAKVQVLADEIARVYHDTAEERAVQHVFCDLRNGDNGFDLYEALREELVARGIDAGEVAFAQDATGKGAKSMLDDAVNAGEIRVVVGSTQTLGTGRNIQRRAIAQWHLDVPWRVIDVEQRTGRILRQGNRYDEVEIGILVVRRSPDGFVCSTVERKGLFMHEVLAGNSKRRTMEDIDPVVFTMKTAKATISDDPLKEEKETLEGQIMKLEIKIKEQRAKRHQDRVELAKIPEKRRILQTQLEQAKADIAERVDTSGDAFLYVSPKGTAITEREEAGRILLTKFGIAEKRGTFNGSAVEEAGTIGGFKVSFEKTRGIQPEIIIQNHGTYRSKVNLDSETATARGLVARVENMVSKIDEKMEEIEKKLEMLDRDERAIQANLAGESPDEQQLRALYARLAEVDRELGIGVVEAEVHEGEDDLAEEVFEDGLERGLVEQAPAVHPGAGRFVDAIDREMQRPEAPAPQPQPRNELDEVRRRAMEQARANARRALLG